MRNGVGYINRNYRLCNFVCTIFVEEPGVAELVDRFLAPFLGQGDRASEVDRRYELLVGAEGEASLRAGDEDAVLYGTVVAAIEQLIWDVSQQGMASVTDELALHAGAVALNGVGVVLPAPSGSGKSTLTAGLTAAGFDYLSDELGRLDLASGIVHPFPRALWMSARSIELVPGLRGRLPPEFQHLEADEQHVPPDSIRSASIGEPCPLRYLIVPEHEPGAPTTMERIRRSEGVLALIGNAFNFSRFKGPGLQALAEIILQVDTYRLRMGDLAKAVDLVVEAVSSP
jgi:hypothetical protein